MHAESRRRMNATGPPRFGTARVVLGAKGVGCYLRAGRSRSSRPPGVSMVADARAVRKLEAAGMKLLMDEL